MDNSPAVELIDVVKKFGDIAAVNRVSLRIQNGEFFSLLGPSGCGKTTHLRLIAGFEMPTEGEIRISGETQGYRPAFQRPVNTVFQHYALFPHLNVFKNVSFGLEMQRLPREEIRSRLDDALTMVRLEKHGSRRPGQLSGGQQQRVALARVLVNRPKVLLLVVLVIFSFNESRSTAQWSGFNLSWYGEMLADDQVILALWNSLFVAIVATVISTLLGTLAAMGMERYIFKGRLLMDALLYLLIVIPDIAMAIMLLPFFNLNGIDFTPWRIEVATLRLSVPYSVIIGHVAFNISFVAVVVRARLSQMDQSLEEAALDLYADSWRTIWRITLLRMMPGILGGALLAFTLSLNDFSITFFHQRGQFPHTSGSLIRYD